MHEKRRTGGDTREFGPKDGTVVYLGDRVRPPKADHSIRARWSITERRAHFRTELTLWCTPDNDDDDGEIWSLNLWEVIPARTLAIMAIGKTYCRIPKMPRLEWMTKREKVTPPSSPVVGFKELRRFHNRVAPFVYPSY